MCLALTKCPETETILKKCRLPLGIMIHPFKDLSHLPVSFHKFCYCFMFKLCLRYCVLMLTKCPEPETLLNKSHLPLGRLFCSFVY